MKRDYLLACLAFLIVVALVVFAYIDRANLSVLNPQGPVAYGERSVIIITVGLCAIVVIPVFLMLFGFAWTYRADRPHSRRHHMPDWDHHSTAAELIWWLVPSVIIAILGVLAWKSAHALDPYKPLDSSVPVMTVQVVALDWKWLFIYPAQNIATINLLEFPEGTPIRFEITSDAPMNSFWIPSLGGQIMAMPGMTTQLNLMASTIGTFNGFSGNLSGDGFAGMAFSAKSVSQADFDAWVQSIQAPSSTPLTLAAYDALAQPSEYNPPAYYAPLWDNLFETIIMKYMLPPNATPMDMPMPTTTP